MILRRYSLFEFHVTDCALSLSGVQMRRCVLFAMLLASSPVSAQQVGSEDSTFADGILVTSSDVLTCPYKLVQPVTVSITEDYGQDTRNRVFQKLRDQARRAAADAVVLVTKGGAHMTMWAWTRREYTGRAIRYVDRSCAPTQ
jgi:hypothetical protein